MILVLFLLGVAMAADTWVLTLASETRARASFLGWVPSTTTSVGIVREEPGSVHRQELCSVDVQTRGVLGHAVIPDAFVRALPRRAWVPRVEASGDGLRYRADLGEDNLGYDASADATLPDSVGDPRVTDPDRDGHPGMTVRLEGLPVIGKAELYLVQRGQVRLEGDVQGDGSVSGTVLVDRLEQHTVAASHRLFVGAARIEPVQQGSWFSLVPVPAVTTCDDLANASGTWAVPPAQARSRRSRGQGR